MSFAVGVEVGQRLMRIIWNMGALQCMRHNSFAMHTPQEGTRVCGMIAAARNLAASTAQTETAVAAARQIQQPRQLCQATPEWAVPAGMAPATQTLVQLPAITRAACSVPYTINGAILAAALRVLHGEQ